MDFAASTRGEGRRLLRNAMLCLRALAVGLFASLLIQFMAWLSIKTAGPIACNASALCMSDNLQNSLVGVAMSAIGVIIIAAVVRTMISTPTSRPRA